MAGKYSFVQVRKEDIGTHWGLWGEKLEYVPRDGRMTAEHVRPDLESGERQLWAVVQHHDERAPEISAVFVTRVLDYPLKRVGFIEDMAGTGLHDWLYLLPELERAFIEAGCESVEIYGRKGWERVLDGYRVDAVVLRKEL